jgi:carbamoyltransferase
VLDLASAAHRLTGERRLCYAGGVALNCVANGRLLREGPFDEIFIQPAASDDGTALGCALLGWQEFDSESHGAGAWTCASPFLGRTYGDADVAGALRTDDAGMDTSEPQNLAAAIATDIASGEIVALFRGGSEFGPRALGHRSILCDARHAWMRDHLNAAVKHREPFRPFAPIVQEERMSEFFELGAPSPYMVFAARVRRPDVIPAVTHVDGTARVQTVTRAQDELIWSLLHELDILTGVPVVLNTSFNDRGPIVETPKEAVRCFLGTSIDVLYLEGRRVVKPAGPIRPRPCRR